MRRGERGVAVRVIVPGPHIDKELVRQAGRRAYRQLLDCGVRLWEYEPTMLHAKTLCLDGAWSCVGSANFDNRSFQLNDEATLGVSSQAFAADLTAQFARDLEVSEAMSRPAGGAGRCGAARPKRSRASPGASSDGAGR